MVREGDRRELTGAGPAPPPRPGRVRLLVAALGTRAVRPTWRAWISVAVGFGAGAPFLEIGAPRFGQVMQRWYLVFWLGWSLTYLLLTAPVLVRGDMERVAADGDGTPDRTRFRDFAVQDTGITLAVSGALYALGAAALVLPGAAGGTTALDGQLSALSIASVVTGWCVVHVAFAQAYALLEVREGGFAFPGDPPAGYADFCSLALSVATSYSTGGVNATTARTRRQVMAHQVLAFVFNTVILALTIALVLR